MAIVKLAKQLETEINKRLEGLKILGDDLIETQKKIETIQQGMYATYSELKPVESLVRLQNPDLIQFFDSISNLYDIGEVAKK